jgi:hypothetical protein
VKTNLVAGPETLNEPLFPGLKAPEVAVRVKRPGVAVVILQPAKLTMPLVAASGLVVQASVPDPVLTARETELVAFVTTLPAASSTQTTG